MQYLLLVGLLLLLLFGCSDNIRYPLVIYSKKETGYNPPNNCKYGFYAIDVNPYFYAPCSRWSVGDTLK